MPCTVSRIQTLNEPNPKTQPSNFSPWQGSSAIVEQGRHWSSALIWISVSLIGGVFVWSFTARLDQTISVRGRLEPADSVQDIDSPSAGVVRDVLVKEGDSVQIGTPLIRIEAPGLQSRRNALEQTERILSVQLEALKQIVDNPGRALSTQDNPSVLVSPSSNLSPELFYSRQQTVQLRTQLAQLNTKIKSREVSLRLQRRIASDMKPVYESGGLARNQYLNQLNQLQELEAEIASLKGETSRLLGSASSQINDVNKQLINLRSELASTRESLGYKTIRASTSGTVFDLKVASQSVVNQDQVLMKIVPQSRLQASVEITNTDIGFVRAGMPVMVAIDSFPSGEFGFIPGTLTRIGTDALQPNVPNGQYLFPAVVTLKQQRVQSGDQTLNLQSGMGVTANIKLRTRPAITVVTDIFTKQIEGVKRFR